MQDEVLYGLQADVYNIINYSQKTIKLHAGIYHQQQQPQWK